MPKTNEELFEQADHEVNPDGYADDMAESDRRAEKRDRRYAELVKERDDAQEG